jgi:hypothetical protein
VDASAAKKMVARKVGRKLTADDWQGAEKAEKWDPFHDAYDETDIAEAVAYFRLPSDGSAPCDWPQRSRRVFERFARDRSLALALFGFESPLPWSELEGLLRTIASGERAEGVRHTRR